MIRLIVSGLILATAIAQLIGETNSCCDPLTESCQKLVQDCMRTSSDVTRCQSLACSIPPTDSTFTPKPTSPPSDFTPLSTFKPSPTVGDDISNNGGMTSTCCDGTTEMCKMSISMCLATTGNPSICERMACPSPGASPYPTPRQCCDGRLSGCQLSYQGCMNETRNADMC